MVPETLAREHIREVHLDDREPDARQGIAQRHARVRQAGQIDQDSVGILTRSVNAIDQRSLVVGLETNQFSARLLRLLFQSRIDLRKRGSAVDVRFADTQQVQIRSMEYENSLGHGAPCAEYLKAPFPERRLEFFPDRDHVSAEEIARLAEVAIRSQNQRHKVVLIHLMNNDAEALQREDAFASRATRQ